MADNQSKGNVQETTYYSLAIGLALGAGIGVAVGVGIGVTLGDIVLGAAFGTALGAAFGSAGAIAFKARDSMHSCRKQDDQSTLECNQHSYYRST